MNFWHIQLHPNDQGKFPPEKVLRILQKKAVIGLGDWDDGQDRILQFQEELAIGDIVAVRDGKTPIALVEVIGPSEFSESPKEGFDWFEHRRKIRILDIYDAQVDSFEIPQPRGTFSICRDLNTPTSETIVNWYKKAMAKSMITEIRKLLEHKPQIILQGPPGTGKTHLAKEVAKAIVTPVKVSGPMAKIDQFFKTFNAKSEDAQKGRIDDQAALNRFWAAFPMDEVGAMTAKKYAIGTGTNDSFCWWLERGLQRLGHYTPGNCRSYLLYWSPSKDDYSLHGRVKHQEDEHTAMKELASVWAELLATKSFGNVGSYFGDSIILKVLNSYFPEEFFPINSVNYLEKALDLFGTPKAKRDPIELNKEVQAFFLKKKAQFNADVTNIEFMRFLFGPEINLKTATAVNSEEIVSEGSYDLVQFHPAYSYEDFVRGIVAETTDSGVSYSVTDKILMDLAKKATENNETKYVLIIDEINRANLPAVLGELIYALEYRGETVKGMYAMDGDKEAGHAIVIPKNLYIIGTMNTADRSVGHIDYAIRRRFAFYDVLPNESVIDQVESNGATKAEAKRLFGEVAAFFEDGKLLPPFKKSQVQIGHSYFLAKSMEELGLRLEFEIKPILREYVRDGVLAETLEAKIDQLHVRAAV